MGGRMQIATKWEVVCHGLSHWSSRSSSEANATQCAEDAHGWAKDARVFWADPTAQILVQRCETRIERLS
jgi:hypothetical protein